MLLKQLTAALNQIAPLAYAEPWDNTGLLTGDPAQQISKILLAIDYTTAVAGEARDLHCDLVIAYHPPIFSAVKRITAEGSSGLIHDAIRRGVAIYSPHTAWDAATGGTNDFLADSLGLSDVAPLRYIQPTPNYLKLVTFVPESSVEAVSSALFARGAGHIGNYHSCSFRTAGIGTFFGEPGTHPTVGEVGKLERQPEIRLETIIPIARANEMVATLLKVHPYEEPAYDLTPLAGMPIVAGHGRVGTVTTPMTLATVAEQLKVKLQLPALLVAGDLSHAVKRVAICAGAGGELLDAAIAAKADLYLTGELRHHDALKAEQAGMGVVCTLHSNSERPSLKRLQARLRELLPDAPPVLLSEKDRDPFSIR
jgi:dinuclear metal center YbgI/SA1388 family protein